MNPYWKITPSNPAIVDTLRRSVPCHAVTATVLVNRGFQNPEDATAFMHPSLSQLRPPFAIKDMDAAVCRIGRALKHREKILIFGDYDADGVTATAILYRFLKEVEADVSTYLPHRVNDGYGLSAGFITNEAMPANIDLIITVDNGSSSHDAVNQARSVNIDVIIIDHHTITSPFPAAVAVVNPKRPDCIAGLADLAGVGVAFSVLICLRKHLRDSGFWRGRTEPNLKQACDLVALGTIADMVPMREDNRILAQTGLEIIRRNRSRPGVMALLHQAGVATESIGSEDIAYRLAPRLNAAGRMDHAGTALSLLVVDDEDHAFRLAERIETLNNRRREVQQNLLDRIHVDLDNDPILLTGQSLVLWGEGWPEGVLGIVAARLLNEYHRPVVLISTRNGTGKGSARSTPDFDLFRGLAACDEVLAGFGGHAAAAGITIDVSHLNAFRRRFEAFVCKVLKKKMYVPERPIDIELNLNNISDRLLDELELLEPFGNANPEPIFLARDIKVVSWKIVGKTHLSMQLKQNQSSSKRIFQAMQFNVEPQVNVPSIIEEIIYKVAWNRWNQTKKAQIIIEAGSF